MKGQQFVLTALVSIMVFSAHAHTDGLIAYEGKPASEHTVAKNNALAKRLNFSDRVAFDRSAKGLIAEFDAATAALLRDDFTFLEEEIPDTVNPSLYRQALLNQTAMGLYKVTKGIYQVRGTDLSNMTLIRGKTGWILYDVLLTKEAAAQSLKFALAHLPEGRELPVSAMIYSHSHADHFGGARGILDLYPDIPIFGPVNISKEIVDENVLAGNAMSRRSVYQYGSALKASPKGIVDAALGKGLSKGNITYEKPTYILNTKNDLETILVDGIEMQFLNVPGAEAPSEMVTYIPHLKAIWTAEITYHGMHNVYTLRGAKVRDALAWSKYINQMLHLWGEEAEVLFAAHSSPIWGNKDIEKFLRLQRDNYGVLHNQTLRLLNSGVALQDIGELIDDTIPESIFESWHTNGYHGTYNHNARGIYNMYLGYFDMNPANLNPLTIADEAKKYVEYMGGSEPILARAKRDFAEGQYRFVATVLDKLVRLHPDNDEARHLLADSYEQLAYQSEGAGWRNVYLTGAQELRVGLMKDTLKTASQDVLLTMDMGAIFDFLAVRVDSRLAAKEGRLTLNLINRDDGSKYFVELSNGNLSNIKLDKLTDADATLSISKVAFFQLLNKQKSMKELMVAGHAEITGDPRVLGRILSSLVSFDEFFPIVPLPIP